MDANDQQQKAVIVPPAEEENVGGVIELPAYEKPKAMGPLKVDAKNPYHKRWSAVDDEYIRVNKKLGDLKMALGLSKKERYDQLQGATAGLAAEAKRVALHRLELMSEMVYWKALEMADPKLELLPDRASVDDDFAPLLKLLARVRGLELPHVVHLARCIRIHAQKAVEESRSGTAEVQKVLVREALRDLYLCQTSYVDVLQPLQPIVETVVRPAAADVDEEDDE